MHLQLTRQMGVAMDAPGAWAVGLISSDITTDKVLPEQRTAMRRHGTQNARRHDQQDLLVMKISMTS